MERLMVVLVEDLKDKQSYGFMAIPTPDQYAKKAKYVLYHTDHSFKLKTKEDELVEDVFYTSIEKVKISMCTRIVSSAGFGGGLRTTAHIDLDILLKDGNIILYEVVRPDTMDVIFKLLHDKQIPLEDPIGVEAIYHKIEGVGSRNKYLTGNFGKFARKYKLDHPRRNEK